MTELSNNESFLQFIKGFFVTAEKTSQTGGIAYFDLMSSLSCLTLYYHNDDDTLNYVFAINESCAYFNTFNHYSYKDADPDLLFQLQKTDTTLGDQSLFVQSMGGVKVRFKIPHLMEMVANGPIAIHNAELLLNVKSGSDVGFDPVYSLAVVELDSTGKQQFIDDYYEGSAYFGGDYDELSKRYSFNLNRYIQNVLIGDEIDYGIEIIAKGASIYGNRLIFAGPKSTDRPMRLKVTYSKLTN